DCDVWKESREVTQTKERNLEVEGWNYRLYHERPHLSQLAVDAHAEPCGEIAARDRTRGGPHHRLARRGAPAAAVVAHAVFLLIRVVRVSGAEAVLDLVIVPRARVGVLDQDADRRAGRVSFEHAREDAHLIG